jgi:hypothetical protein
MSYLFVLSSSINHALSFDVIGVVRISSMDENMRVKLCDTALSRDLFPSDYHCLGDNENRPVRWMAYESIVRRELHPPSDIVST